MIAIYFTCDNIGHLTEYSILYRIFITCCKYNASRAKSTREFSDAIQEEGTIIQRMHQLSSTKGNSRSKHHQYATSNGQSNESDNSITKKRVTTCRAADLSCTCRFHFTITYSKAHKAWFLKYRTLKLFERDILINVRTYGVGTSSV